MTDAMNQWINYIYQIMQGMQPGQTLTLQDIDRAIDQASCLDGPEQLALAKQMLTALDKNCDGVLTREDLNAHVVDISRELECAINYIRPIMENMQPGATINCQQLIQWLLGQGKSQYVAQAIAQQLLNQLDKTHDGVLSREDLQTQCDNIEQETQTALNYIRPIVAGLQPGVSINFQQVLQWLQGQGKPPYIAQAIAQAIFNALDTTHDGLLSREDLNNVPVPTTTGLITRKNVKALTAAEKKQLIDAILKLKAEGEYDKFVKRHGTAPMSNIHRCPAFLPWHRQFLLDYEKQLQRVSGNPTLALPYWDWAEDAATWNPDQAPIWQEDLLGGNGDAESSVRNGAFKQGRWTIVDAAGTPVGSLKRRFAMYPHSTLPSKADVDRAMSMTTYDAAPFNAQSRSFRNYLEGWMSDRGQAEMHNRVHMWVGGSMVPMTSPNDPVFFFHHCNVDRIWALWQDVHPSSSYQPVSGGPQGQNLNDQMEHGVYGSTTPANMWQYRDLGYTYA